MMTILFKSQYDKISYYTASITETIALCLNMILCGEVIKPDAGSS